MKLFTDFFLPSLAFDMKAKIYTPLWSAWNVLILRNSKNVVCVCENKFYILLSGVALEIEGSIWQRYKKPLFPYKKV